MNDLISRETVMDALDRFTLGEDDAIKLYFKMVTYLRKLPSEQPGINVGYWRLLDKCSNSGYYCSNCCKKLVKEGWSNTVKKIKYCPNCGAKMEVEHGRLNQQTGGD